MRLVAAVRASGREAQLGLIRAHPELAGKAMVAKTLTAESTHEQGKAGLTACTPDEFARIQVLNDSYNQKFGFPFILAVRGPRGTGLTSSRSSARSNAGCTTIPTSSLPRRCATSTGSPRSGWTTSSAPNRRWAIGSGTGPNASPPTASPAMPNAAS
jgi:hypothetical protein